MTRCFKQSDWSKRVNNEKEKDRNVILAIPFNQDVGGNFLMPKNFWSILRIGPFGSKFGMGKFLVTKNPKNMMPTPGNEMPI